MHCNNILEQKKNEKWGTNDFRTIAVLPQCPQTNTPCRTIIATSLGRLCCAEKQTFLKAHSCCLRSLFRPQRCFPKRERVYSSPTGLVLYYDVFVRLLPPPPMGVEGKKPPLPLPIKGDRGPEEEHQSKKATTTAKNKEKGTPARGAPKPNYQLAATQLQRRLQLPHLQQLPQ